MQDFEQLGAFYLGRRQDPETGTTAEPVLYDAGDLTTHAVCVGMTGSGKSGLGVALIEEAAIDGIPVLVIDPKGDMGNLLLSFPDLAADDFAPWIDPAEAARKGRTVAAQAAATAKLWRNGLADWGQGPERIARYASACERVLYTPGSSAGRQISILGSFTAPSAALRADAEALRERVLSATSALLALLGIDADPMQSREHILLSSILDESWRGGRSLDLPGLIHAVQKPPFQQLGVFDLETFFPAGDRLGLAMRINNLLASPGFAAWSAGEPLDIQRLLYADDGRPRVSILSIAHLSDQERMSFVTLLLGELLSWMRSQPGSRSLRAMLYMDEIFGYFPPIANPPSKRPMLTLLKQARAFGVGAVLATQNPVDLDYKGLANAGTWFIGRLQTQRDKERVLEGLQGASAAAGGSLDRQQMERTLSGLGSRVFLMHNVHEDAPVLFHTRWVLSYLAGPMSREQIRRLQPAAADPAPPSALAPEMPPVPAVMSTPAPARPRPQLSVDVKEAFLPRQPGTPEACYRPALLAECMLHFSRASVQLDEWQSIVLLAPLEASTAARPWDGSRVLEGGLPPMADDPEQGMTFAELPPACNRSTSWTRWRKMLATNLYREQAISLWRCRKPKLVSLPGESEGAFRGRLLQAGREQRDLQLGKLRARYSPKLARLQERIRVAEQRVERETDQYRNHQAQVAVSVGATVLGALFGRKLASSRNVGRAASAARRAGSAARERADVQRAEDTLIARQQDLEELEQQFEAQLAELRDDPAPTSFELEEVIVRPRKADIVVERLLLVWVA